MAEKMIVEVEKIEDTEILDVMTLGNINEKSKIVFDMRENDVKMKPVTDEIYIQQLHHLVAMEGNTLTLDEVKTIIQTGIAIPGKKIVEHNEVLGLNLAIDYVEENKFRFRRIGITIKDIQQIHKRIYFDPRLGDGFRKTNVQVSSYIAPHFSIVEHLMEKFVQWLYPLANSTLYPVEKAALAHFKFIYIHPFEDGNGRTARVLMNTILMGYGYPPVTISTEYDERNNYYASLALADAGDILPFVKLIARCTEKTLDQFFRLLRN